jgi:hypothetical protein
VLLVIHPECSIVSSRVDQHASRQDSFLSQSAFVLETQYLLSRLTVNLLTKLKDGP